MQNKWLLITLSVIVLGFVGLVAYSKITAPPEVVSNGSSNFYGKEDSPVTVTEFLDFQCEVCYAYYPAVKQVKELYKDKVRFQVRYFPIEGGGHAFSRLSARSAQAAALQGKFWEMHDKLLEGQKIWELASDPQTYYDKYAKEIGLDMTKFGEDRASEEVNAVINADLKVVRELNLPGTPSFLINGKKVENPGGTVEGLSKMIDAAIKEAGIGTNK